MKPFIFILLLFGLLSCSKQDDDSLNVNSIDQLIGKWEWVSTCGGFVPSCSYASEDHYSVINFGPNGNYTEWWNDTIFLEANYSITKISDTTAMLRINNNKYESPLTIINNHLEISMGELIVTYRKLN